LGVGGLLLGTLFLSGCSGPAGLQGTSSTNVSILKSTDDGTTFIAKDSVTPQQTLNAEVLSMIIDKEQTSRLFIGTRADGIYKSENSGDTWQKLTFPPTKVYGLVQDPISPNVLYASGAWQDRAKLYRSDNKGNSWKEIYTEPANGPVITALAHNSSRSGSLIVGLSTGVLLRTEDSGQTWINVPSASDAVLQLAFDPGHSGWIYALTQTKLLQSKDMGKTFAEIIIKPRPTVTDNTATAANQAVTNQLNGGIIGAQFVLDPMASGVLYVGTQKSGVWKSTDSGVTWDSLNVLNSSKKYPIRAIAISPFNSQELIYSSAQAVYKSTDGGADWSTYQLNTGNTIGSIVYDPSQRGVLYLGLRSF